MKQIKDDADLLEISPDFNIHTRVSGRPRTYRGCKITLGSRELNKVWHYWWLTTVEGQDYGTVFLSGRQAKELRELAYEAAIRSIDKLQGITQLGGNVDLKGNLNET